MTATRPPGLSTRAISAIAVASSRDVLQHLGGDDPVDARVGHGQGEQVAADHLGGRTGGRLPGRGDRVEPLPGGGHLGGAVVEGDDPRAPPVGLECVPALAAAEVEHRHAGAHVQPVVVDGQHEPPRRSSTSPYQSAVRCAVVRQV